MKPKRPIIIAILIFAMFILTFRTGSHTINGYPSPEQMQALQDDYDNAKTELNDWDSYIDAIDRERLKHAALALYFHGQWLGTQSTIRNQLISALSGLVQKNVVSAVASAYGITVKGAMAMYSAYSLESLMTYHISQVNVLESDIEASWDNSATIEGTDEANSIMEAYRDVVAAVNHYNSHSSQSKKKPGEAPIKPSKWDMPKFPCGGSCGEEFDTPDSPHHVKCGSAEDVDKEAARSGSYQNVNGLLVYVPKSTSSILQSRSASDGCGRWYYNCEDEALHQLRTCKKTVWKKPEYFGGPKPSSTCNESYRRCMGHTFDHDHNIVGKTSHSDVADSSTAETAQNEQTPVDNSPNCEHCTNSCSACTQPTTPAMHPCGIHATSVSGDHSLQASCTQTNGWGHSCTVSSYYACQTHTCVFPTFQCGRAACTQAVADREEHRRTCINGRKYWSCNTGPPDMVEHHRTRTCTRYKALRQGQDPLTGLPTMIWGTCGEQWDMCDTRCRDAYGAVGTHQE